MSSMLLRQFIEGRSKYFPIEYTRLLGPKSGQALDKVIPNITKNLTQSNLAFLEAVYDLDEGFIQQTATKGLQKRLFPEFQKLRNSGTTIKEIEWNIEKEQNLLNKLTPEQKEQIKSMVRFTISPYVIFGTTMEQRFEEQNPWDNIMTVASNRFIYKDPKGLSLSNIMNKQVFGFNCFTTKLYKGIEISEGGRTEQYEPKQTIVAFETNADNHEFFVADFNLFTRHS